jgi:hypothetical protein
MIVLLVQTTIYRQLSFRIELFAKQTGKCLNKTCKITVFLTLITILLNRIFIFILKYKILIPQKTKTYQKWAKDYD